MYNTQFKVKYNVIEKELLHKLKNKYLEENNENNDIEYEYSSQDVLDICNKLYRDELLSVFGVDDLADDKLNDIMDYVYNKMMANIEFKDIIYKNIEIYIKECIPNEDIDEEKHKHFRQSILMILFTKQLFHITHKCICQQIELEIIDKELLVELRNNSIELLQH